jgi:integral membrane sensor domain MASE1
MVGVGALVTGVAPLAGGVLLGGIAGKSGPSVPDLRAIISSELDLLQRIPEDEVARRAAVKRMIGEHVEALLVAQEKSREFKKRTRYFTEHWRDLVVLVTTLLFVVIIWHADHHRPIWLPLLIATIVMSVVTAIPVVRGFLSSVRSSVPDGDHDWRDRDRDP